MKFCKWEGSVGRNAETTNFETKKIPSEPSNGTRHSELMDCVCVRCDAAERQHLPMSIAANAFFGPAEESTRFTLLWKCEKQIEKFLFYHVMDARHLSPFPVNVCCACVDDLAKRLLLPIPERALSVMI